MPTKTTILVFVAVLLGCLFTAGASSAIPVCETDCATYTPCDQVCRLQGCQNQYSTCAAYVCDEPQFPWPGFAATSFGDSVLSPQLQFDEVVADAGESMTAANAKESVWTEDASEPTSDEEVVTD